MKTAPRFDQLAATNVAARSNERAAVTKAEADVHSMGLQSVAAVRSAEIQAEAAEGCGTVTSSGFNDGLCIWRYR